MLAVDYWKYHGAKLEPQLIAKSDICLANPTYLADYCRRYNPHSYYVGQGCELNMFTHPAGKTIPADIAHIPKPLIGYAGALQKIRLDIDLLAYIAEQRHEWSIVLAGPEDINAFDVCLNPQLINEVTIGNYPRKIDEYLAMGKPVVATATEAMSIFSAYTYLGTTKDDYLLLIDKALKDDSPTLQSKRIVFASSHTWKNSVKEIYRSINDKYRITPSE